MLLLIVTIAITCIASYFVVRLDEKHPFMNTLIVVSIFGALVIPSLILFIAFDYFNIEGLNVIPATLPLLLMGILVIWATWGETVSGNSDTDTDEKKDDLVADAMILTAVLSSTESKSDSSNNSNSSGNSSSNSDDFFLL